MRRPTETPTLESSQYVQSIGRLTGPRDKISALSWSPDGSWLASSSTDGGIHLWNRMTGQQGPRFALQGARQRGGLAWHPGGRFLACGSEDTGVRIWDSKKLSLELLEDDSSLQAVCMAWDRANNCLAFGGRNGRVNFRNGFDGISSSRKEIGLDHAFPVASMVWTQDGEVLVTGTLGGTIGLWPVSSVDNQLREGLFAPGGTAHDDAVLALAWSPSTGVLASGSMDGRVRLWNVRDTRLLQTVDLGEVVLDVAFSPDGAVLVIQSLNQLWFFRCSPLAELASYAMQADLAPVPTKIALDSAAGRLATVDPLDGGGQGVAVWQVDFQRLLRDSAITKRSYSVAGVALLGNGGVGRTNVALALTNKPFEPRRLRHGFDVHLLRVADAQDETSNGKHETRDVVFWDLPSATSEAVCDHVLVQRMHTGDGLVRILVLEASRGSKVSENVDAWKQTLRLHRATVPDGRTKLLVVVTRCDLLPTWPTPDECALVERELNAGKVFFVSPRDRVGVDRLRSALLEAIDWSDAGSFESIEVFEYLRKFITEERARGKHITSLTDLFDSFCRVHQFLGEHAPVEAQFQQAIRFLELLGCVDTFEMPGGEGAPSEGDRRSDDLLLSPHYFHDYALAIIAASRKDPHSTGRIPLNEVELGKGRQLDIPEPARLPDRQQEVRLLNAAVGELISKGIAQKVSTHTGSYLVVPGGLTKKWDQPAPRDEWVTSCRFSGATDDVYTSLVVRLLGLDSYYGGGELFVNGAVFSALAGGSCGLVLEREDAGDDAELGIFFRDNPGAATQQAFTDIVRKHVEGRAKKASWQTLEAAHAPATELRGRTQRPVEVFFCHRLGRVAQANLTSIAEDLTKRGIRVWMEGYGQNAGGRRADQLALCRVAAVFLDGEFGAGLRADCRALVDRGAGIVPVILPNAPHGYELPAMLAEYSSVDFGNLQSEPFRRLAEGVTAQWSEKAEPAPKARRPAKRTPRLIAKPRQVDFAIISIRQDEFEAVATRFEPIERCEGELDYLIARVSNGSRSEKVVAMVRSVHQGQNNAGHVARAIIADLNPRWILVVGIAGGMPSKEITLGDVVLSRTIHELDVGALMPGGEKEYSLRGGDVHPEVEAVLSSLRDDDLGEWASSESVGVPRPAVQLGERSILDGDQAWRDALMASTQHHFGGDHPRSEPRWQDGVIATSNDLIRDADVVAAWAKFIRQFVAVEMESGGVYQAARGRRKVVPVLAIRGISDIVGLARDGAWTAYACNTAASLAFALVKSGLASRRSSRK